MRKPVAAYILVVIGLAIACIAFLYSTSPGATRDQYGIIALLSVLAVTAEVLVYLLPRSTRGSIAIVPYLSMAVLVPTWTSVAAVMVVKAITESATRIEGYKKAFNVAQLGVSIAVAIVVFRSLGGTSLLAIRPASLVNVTSIAGGPAIVAFAVSFAVNSILVCGAIAISANNSLWSVLRDVKLSTVGLDLLVSPPIFVFAWVYAAYGPIAAATLWLPFLGLRQTHRTNVELEQTNQELLELMVKSLEARDPYTSGHSRRVKQFSLTIARALNLSQREVEQVGKAALLHDVGKIHEKYAPILSKDEKLTPDEWITMREHPADGAELIATMSKLRDIVPAVRHHHENWDGTGYPDGLAGELIPMASRIIRFADTIDAMTTQRPYRAPLTEAQVRAEIVRCRGTQFDPMITDKLLSSSLWTSLFTAPATVETIERARLAVVASDPRDRRTAVRAGTRA